MSTNSSHVLVYIHYDNVRCFLTCELPEVFGSDNDVLDLDRGLKGRVGIFQLDTSIKSSILLLVSPE